MFTKFVHNKFFIVSAILFGGMLYAVPIIAMIFLFGDFAFRWGWYVSAYLCVAVPVTLGYSIIANACNAFDVSKRVASE